MRLGPFLIVRLSTFPRNFDHVTVSTRRRWWLLYHCRFLFFFYFLLRNMALAQHLWVCVYVCVKYGVWWELGVFSRCCQPIYLVYAIFRASHVIYSFSFSICVIHEPTLTEQQKRILHERYKGGICISRNNAKFHEMEAKAKVKAKICTRQSVNIFGNYEYFLTYYFIRYLEMVSVNLFHKFQTYHARCTLSKYLCDYDVGSVVWWLDHSKSWDKIRALNYFENCIYNIV